MLRASNHLKAINSPNNEVDAQSDEPTQSEFSITASTKLMLIDLHMESTTCLAEDQVWKSPNVESRSLNVNSMQSLQSPVSLGAEFSSGLGWEKATPNSCNCRDQLKYCRKEEPLLKKKWIEELKKPIHL